VSNKLLVALKAMVLITTVILAVVGIMYVLDMFAAENLRKIIEKLASIIGIVTVASLIVIFLTGKK